MRLALSSYTYPLAVQQPGGADHFRLIELARGYDAGTVQYADNMPLHMLTKHKIDDLKKFADDNNIAIETGMKSLTKSNLSEYIDIAQALGSSFIRMVIDDGSYQPSFSEIIRIINSSLPQLRDNKIQLAIENHDRFKSVELKRIIIGTDPGWVRICLDTANSIGCNEGLTETFQVLAPYTINLHLKNVRVDRLPHQMGFVVKGASAGDGILDLAWVVRELRNLGNCRSAVVETWSDPDDNKADAIAKEKIMAEESIKYIKQLLL